MYCPDCTHVIVDNTIEYDVPVCVNARQDRKILVSEKWVKHSLKVGKPALTDSVMYVPRRDVNGIPGAQLLVVCLGAFRLNAWENILLMIHTMGAKCTNRLDETVTHLVCDKFEGMKYDAAKTMKKIMLVNYKWLEECLRKWEIVPEKDYSKSGHELKMEAEVLLKQAVPRSRGFSNAGNVVSATIRSSSDLQKSSTPNLENIDEAAGTNSKSVKRKSLGMKCSVLHQTLDKKKTPDKKKFVRLVIKRKFLPLGRLDDENGRFKWKSEVSNGCSKLQRISLDDDLPIRESSHVEGGQELRKNPQADSDAKSPARITPSKTIARNSSGLKGKDVPADISYLNAASPAKDTASKTTETKSLGFNFFFLGKGFPR